MATEMESLTARDMAQIATQQREAGVQSLSSHSSWPEFCDERRRFHQEFVYDAAMLAASRGFPWPGVIQAAAGAKGLFPQLDVPDPPQLLSLLTDVLSECSTDLCPAHRRENARFLTNACAPRRRLLRAVVGGAANASVAQLHLGVQLPPTPCPLAQGTDLQEGEHHQAELASKLLETEAKLKVLRDGSRVTLGEVDVPEDEQPDKEGVAALVRAAVRAAEDRVRESLSEEASLVADILHLKLQQAALAAGGRQSPVPSSASTRENPKAGQTEGGRRS